MSWIGIFLTTVSRYFGLISSFILVGLITNYIGLSAAGEISIYSLSNQLAFVFSGIFCSSAPIYFAQKIRLSSLLLWGIVWAIMMSVSVFSVLSFLDKIPESFGAHVVFLSCLHAILILFQNIHLGREKVVSYNFSNILLFGTQLIVFASRLWLNDEVSINHYIFSTYCGYAVSMAFLVIQTIRLEVKHRLVNASLVEVFTYGIKAQTTNFFQTLNYRMVVYGVQAISPGTVLGAFSTSLQISEAIWVPAKSIGTVELSKMVSTDDETQLKQNFTTATRITFWISVLAAMMLILIPESIFALYLSEKFIGSKPLFYWLVPGIVIFSLGIIAAQYFASRNKVQINFLGTISGLVVTIIGYFVLIPRFGVQAAALTVTLSHTLNTAVLLFFINKHLKPNWTEVFFGSNNTTR